MIYDTLYFVPQTKNVVTDSQILLKNIENKMLQKKKLKKVLDENGRNVLHYKSRR